MVLLILAVLSVVVIEMMSTKEVHRMTVDNMVANHLAHYGEETALLQVEEVLFQDIEPPPMRPVDELVLTPEEQARLESLKGTDSFHDFWATMDGVEQNGNYWMKTEVLDEERHFNVNTLVDPRNGKIIKKRQDFLEELFKVLEVKEAEINSLVDAIKDRIDPDETGKYEVEDRNGQLKLLSELLEVEEIEEELFWGKDFPSGEIVLEEEIEFDDVTFFDDEVDAFEEDGEGKAKAETSPFVNKEDIPYEQWEDEEIFPGLKDVLTVYGDGKINVNTASVPVLIALLAGDEDAALGIIRERKKRPFKSFDDLKRVSGTSRIHSHHKEMISFQSQYFRVITTFKRDKIEQRRISMMMREGPQAITLFMGARF